MIDRRAILVVFSGLPGSGKTTIARELSLSTLATYLRIDAIEQALRNSGMLAGDVGPSGYGVANAIAEANLVPGAMVIADCVNPVAASRAAWTIVAARANAHLIDVEIRCSDESEHQRRLENRVCDIAALKKLEWEAVKRFAYERWETPTLKIDTATQTPRAAVESIKEVIRLTASDPTV